MSRNVRAREVDGEEEVGLGEIWHCSTTLTVEILGLAMEDSD